MIICPDDPRIVFFNDWGTIVMCPFLHVFLKHLIVIGFLVICPDGPFPYDINGMFQQI